MLQAALDRFCGGFLPNPRRWASGFVVRFHLALMALSEPHYSGATTEMPPLQAESDIHRFWWDAVVQKGLRHNDTILSPLRRWRISGSRRNDTAILA